MLTFLKGGGVLSNYLWTSKSILALDSNVLFWWMWDWYPYFYDSHWQGYFSQYCSCDLLTSDTIAPTNCSCLDIDSSSLEVFKNFFKQVNAWDYAYYSYQPYYYAWQGCANRYWWVSVCYSSNSIWSSFCFKQASCSWGCQWNWCPSVCSQFWWCGGGLKDSQNYTNLTFWNIPYSDIWYAPWQAWYDWGQVIPDWDLTNISCPTVWQLISNYNQNWFSSWLCYSSSRIFNWSSFVSVDPQSIFDLFSSKEDFISSLNKFATYCESFVYNSNVCSEAFSWEDLRFNLISKIPQVTALWWRKSLYTYCGLYNYDFNATTCVASWVLPEYWQDYTYDDVVHSIRNWEYSVYSPITNNTEYNTVFNNSSWYSYSWDIITNIQQLFWKFTSLFKEQTSNITWILPAWIIIPFILLVLFKLFRK